jgi:hypothetical protein
MLEASLCVDDGGSSRAKHSVWAKTAHLFRGVETMQDLRTTIGVALGMSLLLIVGSGFFVHSSREAMLIFSGFATGVIAVYLIERLKASRAKAHSRVHAETINPAASMPVWPLERLGGEQLPQVADYESSSRETTFNSGSKM